MAQMINVFSNVKAKYETSTLIECLIKYKLEHIEEYKVALDAYRIAIRKKLKENLKQFKNKYQKIQDFNLDWSLYPPVNVEYAYDQLIKNFHNMTGDTVELDMSQANCILNNDWDWAKSASISNQFYTSTSSATRKR